MRSTWIFTAVLALVISGLPGRTELFAACRAQRPGGV